MKTDEEIAREVRDKWAEFKELVDPLIAKGWSISIEDDMDIVDIGCENTLNISKTSRL